MSDSFAERFWNTDSLKRKTSFMIGLALHSLATFTIEPRIKKGRGQRRNRRNKR